MFQWYFVRNLFSIFAKWTWNPLLFSTVENKKTTCRKCIFVPHAQRALSFDCFINSFIMVSSFIWNNFGGTLDKHVLLSKSNKSEPSFGRSRFLRALADALVPRPPGSKFFQFHAVCGKSYVGVPWRVGATTSGKSWIHHTEGVRQPHKWVCQPIVLKKFYNLRIKSWKTKKLDLFSAPPPPLGDSSAEFSSYRVLIYHLCLVAPVPIFQKVFTWKLPGSVLYLQVAPPILLIVSVTTNALSCIIMYSAMLLFVGGASYIADCRCNH